MSRLLPIFYYTCAAAFLIGNATGEIYFRKGAPHVQLASKALISGTVQFSRDGRPFNTFAGIPYATVHERFAESELIQEKTWEGVKSMVQPGPICPQAMHSGLTGEEDCLYLNVNVPMNNTGERGYPVMVWIHGGGYVSGSGSIYGPKYIMDEDVILVTLNYRLGVFGFLSTGDEVVPGNNALKDQVNGLRWVQENIRQFHGDPEKVTIFGESAGGASVHLLTLSPLTKGLFHRAISQSSTGLAPWANVPNPEFYAEKFAQYLGCPATSSQDIVTCLKGKSTEELTKAQFEFYDLFPDNLFPLVFTPTTEPSTSKSPFLTQSPWSLLSTNGSKLVNDVPIMFGGVEHEGIHMFSDVVMENEHLLKDFNEHWDKVARNTLLIEKQTRCPEALKKATDKLREFYFGDKAISEETMDNLTDLYSDALIFHSMYRAAVETALRSERSQVYLYHYAHQSNLPFLTFGKNVDASKTGHADELPYLFNIEGLPANVSFFEPDTEHETFSKNLVHLWTSFAKHGEPKDTWGNVGKWNPVSKEEADGRQTVKFLKIDNELEVIDDKYTERMTLWNTIWEDILLKADPHCNDEEKSKF